VASTATRATGVKRSSWVTRPGQLLQRRHAEQPSGAGDLVSAVKELDGNSDD
jgi:hypothetical protein